MVEGGCQVEEKLSAYRLLIADVYELAGTSRRTSDRIAAELGQTAARWHVMSTITDGARTVPSVARRLGLARQSVQRVVNELERDQMVELVPNPDHARSPLVALTEPGRAHLTELLERSDASRRGLLDRTGLTAEQLLATRDVVRRLLDGYREQPEDDRAARPS